MNKPLLGINGCKDPTEVKHLVAIARTLKHFDLMISARANQVTAEGKDGETNSPFASADTLPILFEEADAGMCLTMVHFQTDQPNQLHQDLPKLMQIAGDQLEGFQIDTFDGPRPWPSPRVTNMLVNMGMTLMLRINQDAITQTDGDATVLASAVNKLYGNKMHYVSFGLVNPATGLTDPDRAAYYLEFFKKKNPGRRLMITGPIDVDRLHELLLLAHIVPNLGVSADDTLIDPITHQLDLERAEAFLRKTDEFFGRNT